MTRKETRASESATSMAVCLIAAILIIGIANFPWVTLGLIGGLLVAVALILVVTTNAYIRQVCGHDQGEPWATGKEQRTHPQNFDPLGQIFMPFRLQNLLPEIRIWWSGTIDYFDHPDLSGDGPNFWTDWCNKDTAPWPNRKGHT
jgi:hypothetical protein